MTKRAKLTVGEEIVDAIRMADQRYEARVDLATLHEFPGNPKTHDRRLIDQSIDKNGFYGALLCQRSTRRILAGHGRRSSVLGKGQTHVPVLWIDCDDKKRVAS